MRHDNTKPVPRVTVESNNPNRKERRKNRDVKKLYADMKAIGVSLPKNKPYKKEVK